MNSLSYLTKDGQDKIEFLKELKMNITLFKHQTKDKLIIERTYSEYFIGTLLKQIKDLENANSRLTATNDLLVKSKELLKNDMKKCGCY